jgi:two-component system response regulator HydG
MLKNAHILAIDDDSDVLTAVKLFLKKEVKEITIEKNPNTIPYLLGQHKFDLVLLDMNFDSAVHTGNEGLYWLKRILELAPGTKVIMITAYGGVDLAVRSLKEGAQDFLIKPWHNDRLLETITEILHKKPSSLARSGIPIINEPGSELLGDSPLMRDIFKKIEKIAPTDANIFIQGENGTGKDLIAKEIHLKSLRADKPFIKVDLGSLTESLFESELFGYKKGAFTDAKEDRMGRFEEANGGTLFLDEIGNTSLHQQIKLLTVLQNRQVTRLGSNRSSPIDIRLISATNLPFSELANENRFRKDLIYRINTIELILPPLRDRSGDISLLVKYFLKQYGAKYLKLQIGLDSKALQKLESYHFPGNIRELQYIIERAVIMNEEDRIGEEDLIFSSLENSSPEMNSSNLLLSNIEKSTIQKVMEKHNGNITKVAKDLGLTRTALYRRLSKYGL